MSKSPDPKIDPAQLVDALESSLQVEYLRGGSNSASTDTAWTTLPFTLIGQSPDNKIRGQFADEPMMHQPAGAGYIIPEASRYRSMAPVLPGQIFHWSHVRFRVLGEVDLFHFIQSPGLVPPSIGERIANINNALVRTRSPGDPSLIVTIARRRLLCSQLLSLIVEVSRPRPGAWQTLAHISRLLPVLRFMREQIGRPVLREELRRMTGLSPSRFHALFLDATGLPPQRFLMNMRLRAAQEQLISSDRSIYQIATAVGFRDAFHFSRMFKRLSGVGPRDYRNRAIAIMTSPDASED